ncbi:hypothetical protein [Ferrimicrobium sp.]|uniref:hypothetical protein n=1 Tax=Ferrimicrobium sp. TaxID=2926050 RepID=UPI0026099892|nr:hypothetical protein [Ferrimicrobium sp.]
MRSDLQRSWVDDSPHGVTFAVCRSGEEVADVIEVADLACYAEELVLDVNRPTGVAVA